jgi:hypothetical protein
MVKSPAWWPTAPSAGIYQKYEGAGVRFLRTEGILVVKVRVGFDTYVRTQLLNNMEELRTRMQVMGDFQNTQAALLILRVCMSVCRVNFLLRALPQPLVKDAAAVFDDLIRRPSPLFPALCFQIGSGPRLSCPSRHPPVRDVG